ncbi:MAG: threonine synthase [Planctomycetota bacterium]|jgi:threonine synthase|nr:threonine synthase [Planctomycetota bacterium]
MDVVSTRSGARRIPALQAVLEGIAGDGGLFVPVEFPRLDSGALLRDHRAGYAHVATAVLDAFFDVGRSTLHPLVSAAYAGFGDDAVAPLRALGDGTRVMELFHGPTLAFKDMALQILPRLFRVALEKFDRKDDALILTATSGDTGKAALEGFRNVPRTAVYVFYPEDGVAEMQRLQMATQRGGNVGVCAVKGNFDDAQAGVKRLFADRAFAAEAGRAGKFLSSANSINIGRLVPQIAYYCNAYAKLVDDGVVRYGDGVNFAVPTGNFGNILAAHYAKAMGLPVARLICASNSNNVLTDFFNQGRYDARRTFHKTMSPSMDILASSNLERLLHEICGRDHDVVRGWMRALSEKGVFDIPAAAREKLSGEFYADFCDEGETAAAIRRTYETDGYLIDPHTAVGVRVHQKYRERTGDDAPTVVASTANPYKFTPDVLASLTGETEDDAFEAAAKLAEYTGGAVPECIAELKRLPVLHDRVAEKDRLDEAARNFLLKIS